MALRGGASLEAGVGRVSGGRRHSCQPSAALPGASPPTPHALPLEIARDPPEIDLRFAQKLVRFIRVSASYAYHQTISGNAYPRRRRGFCASPRPTTLYLPVRPTMTATLLSSVRLSMPDVTYRSLLAQGLRRRQRHFHSCPVHECMSTRARIHIDTTSSHKSSAFPRLT